jgi:hypothetical protein
MEQNYSMKFLISRRENISLGLYAVSMILMIASIAYSIYVTVNED